MQERVLNHPHITVLFEHNAVGLFGDNGVEGMHVVKRMGEATKNATMWLLTDSSWPSVTNRILIFSSRG